MRHGRAAGCQAAQFRIGGMHIMRQHRASAIETEPLVYRQVVGCPWEQSRHLRDLVDVFIEMRLNQQPVVLAQQGLTNLQHGF